MMYREIHSREAILFVILVSYELVGLSDFEISISLSLSKCQGFSNPLSFSQGHPEYPFIDEDFFAVTAFQSNANFFWKRGCVVLQNRKRMPFVTGRLSALMIHVYSFRRTPDIL